MISPYKFFILSFFDLFCILFVCSLLSFRSNFFYPKPLDVSVILRPPTQSPFLKSVDQDS